MKSKIVLAFVAVLLVVSWCYYPHREVSTVVFKMKLPLPGMRSRCIGRLIADLDDGRLGVPSAAAFALGETGDARAVPPLIAVLKGSNSGLSVAAAIALARMGPLAVDPLIVLLQDSKADARRQAVLALRESRDLRAVEPLVSALKDEDPDVRREVVEALGDIRDARVAGPLISVLKEPRLDIRQKAIRALGRIKDPRAVEPLVMALKDPQPEIRKQAAVALGEIGDPRAVEPLVAALKDRDGTVREGAARSLGEIKDARATGPLIALLKDEEWGVRVRTAGALDRIGWRPAEIEEKVRWLAASRSWDELAGLGASGVGELTEALKDKSPDIRAGAAKGMGLTADHRVVDPLIVALKDPNCFVRRQAAQSLGRIGESRAVPAVAANLTDWDSRDIVVGELFRLAWRPRCHRDWVHVLISQSNFVALKNKRDWPQTREALMKDLRSGDDQTIRYAANSLIALGQDDTISVLIETLNAKGNKPMAETYANCGQPELKRAAEEWGRAHGCTTTLGPGVVPLPWGCW